MKIKYHFLVAILLCIIVVNLYLYYKHNQITQISCQGSVKVSNDSHTLNAQISLSLSGEIGVAIVNGELIDSKGETRSVHHSSLFRFKQNGNNFYVSSYSVAELANNAVDQSTLKTILPPYLLFKDISARVDIYPIRNDGYLIVGDEYMHLYCEN